jgi:hypothetical protein
LLDGLNCVHKTEKKSTRLDQLRGQAQKLRKLTLNLDQSMQAGQDQLMQAGQSSLGVVSEREGFGKKGRWFWRLPAHRGSEVAIDDQPEQVIPYTVDDPL